MLAKNLSFLEIKKCSSKLAILPLGSLEQHGPYLPLGTDAIVTESAAQAVEERLKEKVVLYPALYYGCSKEHWSFPGTVYFEYSTYLQLVKEMVRTIFNVGFSKLLIIGGHGGNDLILKVAQADWNYDHPTKKLYYKFAFTSNVTTLGKELFGSMESHAGSVETSLVYSLSKDFIKTERKAINNKRFIPPAGKSFALNPTHEISRVGIIAKSRKLEIDIKKGAKIFDTMVDDLCVYAKDLQNGK